jgi:hypothetical protein
MARSWWIPARGHAWVFVAALAAGCNNTNGGTTEASANLDMTMGAADAAGADLSSTGTADGSVVAPPDLEPPPPPAATQLTKAGDFITLFDAVPDPTGQKVYFTGVDATGTSGVFSVPVGAQPAAATAVATAPLVAPIGIAISTDGTQLLVADSGADQGNDLGAIYSVSSGGGTPAVLVADVDPRGLVVLRQNGTDSLYFTGTDHTNGKAGVFRVATAGGAVTPIAEGAPFVDPSGIAAASSGDLFVADTLIAAGLHQAAIVHIAAGSGTANTIPSALGPAYPLGVALVAGDTRLLVSGLDPMAGTDTVLAYDVTTLAASPYVESIGAKPLDGAAGLHRAPGSDTLAFVDSAGDGSDAVYLIK